MSSMKTPLISLKSALVLIIFRAVWSDFGVHWKLIEFFTVFKALTKFTYSPTNVIFATQCTVQSVYNVARSASA